MKTVKIPERMRSLSRDDKGRPVPYFVTWGDGKPDFRVVNAVKMLECYQLKLCFICGLKLGTYQCFVIGPMSAVQRVSAEPPSHYECAHYAVQVCPFLAMPNKGYRDADLPDGTSTDSRIPTHNPGVTAIWVTKSYDPFVQADGLLFRLGYPERVEWYREGRPASRSEVVGAFEYGAGRFYQIAEEEHPEAAQRFEADFEKAKHYWPKESA